MTSYRLIFLDFDGCLNSNQYFQSDVFKEETKCFSDADLYLTKNYCFCLDPEPIKLVNGLVERSEAKVVASTSHRLRFSLEELNELLTQRGATFQLADKTPKLYPKKFSKYIQRGEEVQSFLDQQSNIDSFVILDDCNDMLHLTKHLVLIDYKLGFQPHHIPMAMRILDGKRK